MNTYAISEPNAAITADPLGFGPFGDHVRVLYWATYAAAQRRYDRLEGMRGPFRALPA
jgi:hypothetical protein